MKDMILFPEDIDRLNVVLSQLVTKANLMLAILINKDGRLLTTQGSLDRVDTISLAALVAGNSASTLAIANLVGETEFSAMYHQGKDKNIFITLVDDNTFMSLVFDDRTNIDRVKVFARQFERQLKLALEQVYNKSEDDVNLDLDMGGSDFAQFGADPVTAAQQEPADQQQPPPPESAYNVYNTPPGFVSAPQQQPQQPGNASPPVSKKKIPDEHEDVYYVEGAAQGVSPAPADDAQNEGAAFFDVSGEKFAGDPHDTNYLYLKNKIRETVKRKKEE